MSILKPLLRIPKRLMREFCLSVWYPRVYRRAARQPLVPGKVVFVEVREPKLSDSFKLMHECLQREPQLSLSVLFLGESRVRYTQYHRNCLAMLREIATAPYVFLNDASNVVSCVPLREGSQVVQLWHGCGAFKKWGMSTADLIFGLTAKDLKEYPNYKNLDYVTVSSPEVSWAYVEAMDLSDRPETVVPLGISRSDIFYDEAFKKKAFEKLYALMPSAKGKKVILYAPTFGGRVAKAKTPEMLDVGMFKAELGDEYVLIFKHHPFVKKPMEIERADSDFAQDLTDACEIEELLCVADICISDYSSLVFEYALFEKPMIFFSYDISEYFDWRGFYYDYDEMTPGPIVKDSQELIRTIKEIDADFDPAEVAAFREKFMSACDGKATARILDTICS